MRRAAPTVKPRALAVVPPRGGGREPTPGLDQTCAGPSQGLVHHPSGARARPARPLPELRASPALGRGPPCSYLVLDSPVASGAWFPLLSLGRGWTGLARGARRGAPDTDTFTGRGPASSLGPQWGVGAPGPRVV